MAKLTIRLDSRLIARAKAHAARTGRSLSRMIADILAQLDEPRGAAEELPGAVRELVGAFRGRSVEEKDYRRHLERKHR